MRALISRFMVTWQWLNLNVVRRATIKQLLPALPPIRGYFDFSFSYYCSLKFSYIAKHLFTVVPRETKLTVSLETSD